MKSMKKHTMIPEISFHLQLQTANFNMLIYLVLKKEEINNGRPRLQSVLEIISDYHPKKFSTSLFQEPRLRDSFLVLHLFLHCCASTSIKKN
jgi:hypothetical protein